MFREYGPPTAPPPPIHTSTGLQPVIGHCSYCAGPINGPIYGGAFCSMTCVSAGNHPGGNCSCSGACDCQENAVNVNHEVDGSISGTTGQSGGGPGANGGQ